MEGTWERDIWGGKWYVEIFICCLCRGEHRGHHGNRMRVDARNIVRILEHGGDGQAVDGVGGREGG